MAPVRSFPPSPSSPSSGLQAISLASPVPSPTASSGVAVLPASSLLGDTQPKKKEIRRLPKSVIKAGEYGEEYEDWKRKQEEAERQKLADAVAGIGAIGGSSSVPVVGVAASGTAGHVVARKAPAAGKPQQQGQGRNRIKMEVVERGVPVKKWLLIKWAVGEGAENDSVCLFEEDVTMSNEVWSLALSSIKPKGSTHCAYPLQNIGRFFAAYLRENGTLVCQSRTLVIGPKVSCKAEVKERRIRCNYLIEAKEKGSWDWVGLYVSTQRRYQDYYTWSYVDMATDLVTFDVPVTPGEYVCCYFSAARKFCPLAFSNPVVVPDINSMFVAEAQVKVSGALSVTFDIKSNPRDHSDWIGLFRGHEYKKHQYLAFCTGALNSNTVTLIVPPQVEPGEYVVRYVSMSAQPLTGGAIITSSPPFQVVA